MFPTRKISIHSENDSNESKPNKKIFKSPLPFYLFTPSEKLIQQILLRKKDFPFKRKEMCNKLNLTLYQIQKIERKFIGYGMTGILFMMKEYNISKEYEFILHDFLFKNIRFINKD